MIVFRLASLSAILAVPHLWMAHAAAPQTLRYTILSNGKTVAGSEVDTYGPDGDIDSTFEFNDRGRGPKIAAHYAVATDGLPTRLDVRAMII